jgi:hypothetical protein
LDQQRAEEKALLVLKDGVDLRPFQFTGSKSTILSLVCSKHGSWTISWDSFLRSEGKCPRCSYEAATPKRINTLALTNASSKGTRWGSYLRRFQEIHGGKYDYLHSIYVDAKTPVTIVCPAHGTFEQTPDSHLKSGCRKCADDDLAGLYSDRYFELKPEMTDVLATLYLLRLSWGELAP